MPRGGGRKLTDIAVRYFVRIMIVLLGCSCLKLGSSGLREALEGVGLHIERHCSGTLV